MTIVKFHSIYYGEQHLDLKWVYDTFILHCYSLSSKVISAKSTTAVWQLILIALNGCQTVFIHCSDKLKAAATAAAILKVCTTILIPRCWKFVFWWWCEVCARTTPNNFQIKNFFNYIRSIQNESQIDSTHRYTLHVKSHYRVFVITHFIAVKRYGRYQNILAEKSTIVYKATNGGGSGGGGENSGHLDSVSDSNNKQYDGNHP